MSILSRFSNPYRQIDEDPRLYDLMNFLTKPSKKKKKRDKIFSLVAPIENRMSQNINLNVDDDLLNIDDYEDPISIKSAPDFIYEDLDIPINKDAFNNLNRSKIYILGPSRAASGRNSLNQSLRLPSDKSNVSRYSQYSNFNPLTPSRSNSVKSLIPSRKNSISSISSISSHKPIRKFEYNFNYLDDILKQKRNSINSVSPSKSDEYYLEGDSFQGEGDTAKFLEPEVTSINPASTTATSNLSNNYQTVLQHLLQREKILKDKFSKLSYEEKDNLSKQYDIQKAIPIAFNRALVDPVYIKSNNFLKSKYGRKHSELKTLLNQLVDSLSIIKEKKNKKETKLDELNKILNKFA